MRKVAAEMNRDAFLYRQGEESALVYPVTEADL